MATVVDRARPWREADQHISGNKHITEHFRGTTHVLAISGTHAPSAVFGKRCSHIKIAPTGNIYYKIGIGAVATANDSYLAAGAVLIEPVSEDERISILQVGASTGNVHVTENRS